MPQHIQRANDADQRFVAALYRDELGRTADLGNPQDGGGWVSALDSGGQEKGAHRKRGDRLGHAF